MTDTGFHDLVAPGTTGIARAAVLGSLLRCARRTTGEDAPDVLGLGSAFRR